MEKIRFKRVIISCKHGVNVYWNLCTSGQSYVSIGRMNKGWIDEWMVYWRQEG